MRTKLIQLIEEVNEATRWSSEKFIWKLVPRNQSNPHSPFWRIIIYLILSKKRYYKSRKKRYYKIHKKLNKASFFFCHICLGLKMGGLQFSFYFHHLLKIIRALKNVTSNNYIEMRFYKNAILGIFFFF